MNGCFSSFKITEGCHNAFTCCRCQGGIKITSPKKNYNYLTNPYIIILPRIKTWNAFYIKTKSKNISGEIKERHTTACYVTAGNTLSCSRLLKIIVNGVTDYIFISFLVYYVTDVMNEKLYSLFLQSP